MDRNARWEEAPRRPSDATPCDAREESRRRTARVVQHDARARLLGRGIVDPRMVLGERVAALAEEREHPGRHRPRGRHEARDREPSLAKDPLALVETLQGLVVRDVTELGLATRDDLLREEITRTRSNAA